jgi:aquaporin Z
MQIRKYAAECLGTALLVFFTVGIATLAFGVKLVGGSPAAGIVMTAFGFGLVLLALAYAIGPISGCHVNPAVTLGFVVSGRMSLADAAGYWIAQFVGGIIGAFALWAIFSDSAAYSIASSGLGTDGWGAQSMIGLGLRGAFAAEVVLSFLFVLVVLTVTSHTATASSGGLAIGMALTLVHLLGIPLTGTSVNPARSLGPALVVGGEAMHQVWLFLVAPMVGGAIAAVVARALLREARPADVVGVKPLEIKAAG